MRSKVITTLIASYENLSGKMVFLMLFAYTLFLRLPFFFRDYMDRDESTFILVAQSLVDGHLPYTELWDLKPPVIYFFFAGIIYIFGKSFVAIRMAGVLAVALTAFFTYKIMAGTGTPRTGFRVAVACVMLLSMFGSLQGVMSEHICMLFFMPALFILIRWHNKPAFLMAGVLVGLTVMTKLNMAYAGLLLGCFILIESARKPGITGKILPPFLYGAGILLVVLLTFLPYYFQEQSAMWWNSVILASLEYSANRRHSILALSPIFILVGGFLLVCWKYRMLDFRDRNIRMLITVAGGVLLSFLTGGRVNGHYLIQLHPILLVLAGMALANAGAIGKWRVNAGRYGLILAFLLPVETYFEYGAVLKYNVEHGTFFNGEGIRVPRYLCEHHIDTTHILFLEYHIGYWVLGKNPPTRAATHPSNICRDEIFPFYNNPRKTSLEELKYILAGLKPGIIVTRANRPVFDLEEIEENAYVDAYLREHYQLLASVENADIYRRSE